jgi:hypothetical protein
MPEGAPAFDIERLLSGSAYDGLGSRLVLPSGDEADTRIRTLIVLRALEWIPSSYGMAAVPL